MPYTGRALAAASALAVCLAVWEIDPRWVTEYLPELNTREQGDLNQSNIGGSQAIAWIAAPLTVGLFATVVWWQGNNLFNTRSITEPPDWLGMWLAWSILSAFFAPNPLLSFVFSASFITVALSARFITRHSPQLTAMTMVVGSAIFVAISIASRLLGLTNVTLRNDRLTWLSLEANQFGRMAALACLAGLYLLFEHTAPATRIFGGASAAAALGAIAMTGSRTGFLATAIALLVLVLVKRSRWALGALAVVGLVSLILMSATSVGQTSIDRLTRSANGSGDVSSLTGRTEIWPVVLDIVGEHPLSGQGLGSTTLLISPRSGDIGFTAEHTHNAGLHVWVTTGAVGLALFLAMATSGLRHARGRGRPWTFAFLAYFAVAGISEAVFRNPDISLVALVFALTLAENRAEESDETKDHASPHPRAHAVAR